MSECQDSVELCLTLQVRYFSRGEYNRLSYDTKSRSFPRNPQMDAWNSIQSDMPQKKPEDMRIRVQVLAK